MAKVLRQLTNNVSATLPGGVTQFDVIAISARKFLGPFVPGFLDPSGGAWMMGPNLNGQVGNGGVVPQSSPNLVSGAVQFNKLIGDAGGSSMYALNPAGQLYSWGQNANGQLGQGGVTPTSSPTLVGGVKFVNVFTGTAQAFLIGQNGMLYTMGINAQGALGTGDQNPRSVPTLISGASSITGVTKVAPSINQTNRWALMVNGPGGSSYASGYNGWGALGNGSVTNNSTFVFNTIFLTASITISDVATNCNVSGNQIAHWLTGTGAVYSAGYNGDGCLGDGTITPRSSPVLVLGGLNVQKIITNEYGSTALFTTAGAVYTMGVNANGQLGDGTVLSRSSPVLVQGGLTFVKVLSSQGTTEPMFAGLATNGKLYCWGANTKGELGLGNTTPASSPTQIVGLSFASTGVVGDFMILSTPGNAPSVFALATNQFAGFNLYAWGDNTNGQLGLGDTTARSSPVQVIGAVYLPGTPPGGAGTACEADLPTVTKIAVTTQPGTAVAQFLNQGPATVNGVVVGVNVDKVFISYDQ